MLIASQRRLPMPAAADRWRDASHRTRRRVGGLVVAGIAALFLAGLLVSLTSRGSQRTTAPAPIITTDAGGRLWSRDPNVISVLAIRAPLLTGLPREVGVWRRQRNDGEEVQDRLTAGTLEGSGPFISLAALRRSPDDVTPSLFVDVARLIADGGLAVRRFAPSAVSRGRFGATEVAPVALAGAHAASPVRESCAAWRTEAVGVGIALVGVACLPGQGLVTLARVECLLRALTVPEGMEDRGSRVATAAADATCETAWRADTRVSSLPRTPRTRLDAKLSPSFPVGPDGGRAID